MVLVVKEEDMGEIVKAYGIVRRIRELEKRKNELEEQIRELRAEYRKMNVRIE